MTLSTICIIIYLSRIPIGNVTGTARRLWLFFSIIFLMNAVFFDSENVICAWWIFHPSIGGIKQGISVVARVLLVLILGNVFISTTSPTEVTTALERLIKPLRILGVPTEDVAMIISVAVQFIPTLTEEIETIRMAQTARGARFESKKLKERALSLLPLVIPIFLAAFRRADELSLAMEARGYRKAKTRTKQKGKPIVVSSYAALCFCVTVCLVQFLLLR